MTRPMRRLSATPTSVVEISRADREAVVQLVKRQARDEQDAYELLSALGLGPERKGESSGD